MQRTLARHITAAAAIAAVTLLGAEITEAAPEPEQLVRAIYTSFADRADPDAPSVGWLSAREQRTRHFSRRMVEFFDANDTYGDDLAFACIDFSLELNGQDFAEREILATLETTATDEEGRRVVEARFTNFGDANRFRYEFVQEDGSWKIDDIASLEGAVWRVSEIPCKPASGTALQNPETIRFVQRRLAEIGFNPGEADGRFGARTAAALRAFEQSRGLPESGRMSQQAVAALARSHAVADPPAAAKTAGPAMSPGDHCFAGRGSALKLSIRGDGEAFFSIESEQGGGHLCGLEGLARQTEGGWQYVETVAGGSCRLDIFTRDGGIGLRDSGGLCRELYCGARADFDSIEFSGRDEGPC